MKIGVDIDGTIADYNLTATTKKHLGREEANDVFICFSESAILKGPGEELLAVFQKYARQKAILIDGAVESIRRLRDKGHNIIIYSNRLLFMDKAELEDWLRDNKIPFTAVWAKRNPPQLDYHVDDNPAKLVNLGDGTRNKLLFDQPWNRRCLDVANIRRVYNWKEVEEIIDASG